GIVAGTARQPAYGHAFGTNRRRQALHKAGIATGGRLHVEDGRLQCDPARLRDRAEARENSLYARLPDVVRAVPDVDRELDLSGDHVDGTGPRFQPPDGRDETIDGACDRRDLPDHRRGSDQSIAPP